MTSDKRLIVDLLKQADIHVNGVNPWDPQVHDERFYRRVLNALNLGMGEAYMDGWWDCAQLDVFFYRVLYARLEQQIKLNPRMWLKFLPAFLFNLQHGRRAYHIGTHHYDTGNDLFEVMLDRWLTYTCGYWKNAATLDEAQEAKLDLICKKIGLKPGQTVLDIGCGWGSFSQFAAERYGASVVGITVSKQQLELGRKRCQGLPVELRMQSYTELDGQFDHIVSLGMFEHVGYKNHRTYFEVANRLLKEDGLFLLHTIGSTHSVRATDPWINTYIFPNSMLPSVAQIGKAVEGLFVVEDLHNFGADYDKTLMAWHHNISTGWKHLKGTYSKRFYRMWEYFLLSCAGSFRARNNQLWQIVLSKRGVPGGYVSLR